MMKNQHSKRFHFENFIYSFSILYTFYPKIMRFFTKSENRSPFMNFP
ncbi:hypothetical protein BCO26_1120 [Heyndrickxia coagulans 2-6]|nr:hypothetical protein BCO26_1120 [Heyndrickxia coagulans 2-6]